jgi:hypothetical protein
MSEEKQSTPRADVLPAGSGTVEDEEGSLAAKATPNIEMEGKPGQTQVPGDPREPPEGEDRA